MIRKLKFSMFYLFYFIVNPHQCKESVLRARKCLPYLRRSLQYFQEQGT